MHYLLHILMLFLLLPNPNNEDVEWSKQMTRDDGFENEYLGTKGDEIYMLYKDIDYKTFRSVTQSINIDVYDKNSLELKQSRPLTILAIAPKEKASYMYYGTYFINENFISFVMEYDNEDLRSLYYTLTNVNGEPIAEPKILTTAENNQNTYIVQSKDKTHTAVLVEEEVDEMQKTRQHITLFNEKGEVTWQNEYMYQYSDAYEFEEIPPMESLVISDDGSKIAFSGPIEYGKDRTMGIYIYDVKRNTNTEIITNIIESRRRETIDASLTFSGDRLYIGGVIWKSQLYTVGYYFAEVSEENKKLKYVKEYEFEPEDFDQKKLGNGHTLAMTNTSELIAAGNGNILLLLSSETKTQAYQSDQGFIINFSPEGKREWLYFLDKKQALIGNYYRFIGSKNTILDDKIVMVFNDNEENYVKPGKKTKTSTTYSQNGIAIRMIDLYNGKESRSFYPADHDHFIPPAAVFLDGKDIYLTLEGIKKNSDKMKLGKITL